MNNIQDIIKEIKRLEKELLIEIQKNEEKFLYQIKGKRVFFEEEAQRYQKKFVTNVVTYLADAPIFNIFTVPIIWSCIIPALLLDVAVTLYQYICFTVYKIPKVNRSEYIVFDHHSLHYLNLIEKINCIYCSYFNGLIAYTQEIAARTEQYWCPIKHARKLAAVHSRYHKFLEYGDCEEYQKKLQELRKDYGDINNGEP